MFSKILVPLDGSQLALRVLKPLRKLVAGGRSELTLLRVVEPDLDPDLRSVAEAAMRGNLEQAREEVGLDVPIRTELLHGDAAGEIVRYALASRQELVVMATHGRSGLSRLVRGSVAERVLRSSAAPLLLCNPHALEGSSEHRFGRILVALDGSERSERVLPATTHVAAAHDARVTVLRVEPWVLSELPSPLAGAPWDPTPLLQSLAPVVERLESAGLRAEARATYGPVAAEILREARGADLLALTTHGRSGVSRAWSGSVAEEVLRQASCPLLVVRAP